MRKKRLAKWLLLVTCSHLLVCALPSVAKKSTAPSGENVFKESCASCHPGGGNIIKAHKPIAGSTKLSTLGVFKAYLKSPVGHMPYYKNVVSDPKVLQALFDYCKSLKPPEQAQSRTVDLAGR